MSTGQYYLFKPDGSVDIYHMLNQLTLVMQKLKIAQLKKAAAFLCFSLFISLAFSQHIGTADSLFHAGYYHKALLEYSLAAPGIDNTIKIGSCITEMELPGPLDSIAIILKATETQDPTRAVRVAVLNSKISFLRNELEEALSQMARAKALAKKTNGLTWEDTLEIQLTDARITVWFDQAEGLLQSLTSLELILRKLPQDDIQVKVAQARLFHEMSIVASMEGKAGLSIQYTEKAAGYLQGINHPVAYRVMARKAKQLEQQGKKREALELMEQATATARTFYREESPHITSCMLQEGYLTDLNGDLDK
ncbi:MAG: hypothetical protein R3B47_10770 [Bacteroidia bacterium]